MPTPAHTLGDDSLLLKYINPRLLAFATLSPENSQSVNIAGGNAGGKGQKLMVSESISRRGRTQGEGRGEGGGWLHVALLCVRQFFLSGFSFGRYIVCSRKTSVVCAWCGRFHVTLDDRQDQALTLE